MKSGHLVFGNVVSVDPDVLGGTPVFNGTRVPVQIFIDYVKEHIPLEEFYDGFPTVSKDQTDKLLEIISEPSLT